MIINLDKILPALFLVWHKSGVKEGICAADEAECKN
jgi:hypothetical protein